MVYKIIYQLVPGQKPVDVTPIRDNHSRLGAGNELGENQQERRNGAVDLSFRSCFGGEATCTGSEVFFLNDQAQGTYCQRVC